MRALPALRVPRFHGGPIATDPNPIHAPGSKRHVSDGRRIQENSGFENLIDPYVPYDLRRRGLALQHFQPRGQNQTRSRIEDIRELARKSFGASDIRRRPFFQFRNNIMTGKDCCRQHTHYTTFFFPVLRIAELSLFYLHKDTYVQR